MASQNRSSSVVSPTKVLRFIGRSFMLCAHFRSMWLECCSIAVSRRQLLAAPLTDTLVKFAIGSCHQAGFAIEVLAIRTSPSLF